MQFLWSLRWYFIFALFVGPVVSGFGYHDYTRLTHLDENGLRAVATVHSAVETKRRLFGKSYTLEISWLDTENKVRVADEVDIDRRQANRIIRNNTIVLDNINIVYLEYEPRLEPTTVDSLPKLKNNAIVRFLGGIAAALIGLLGCIIALFIRPQGASLLDEDQPA